jgi:hypothetical protein
MSEDRNARKEPAEGSRRTVDEALKHQDEGPQGVTNKSASTEAREQERVPPRGTHKAE